MPRSDEPGILLAGLDGGNPLGFLAAVGTLRIAATAESDAEWRMRWVSQSGSWFPEIKTGSAISRDKLIQLLIAVLRPESTPEFDFSKNLSVKPEEFGKVAKEAQSRASQNDRRYADFIASFGCEVLETREGHIQDTAFRTMSGAGHQHFLDTMKQLMARTQAEDLRHSLFETWSYADIKLGLRWDPLEDRRYALRWADPSGGGGVKTVRGANRLAVEALPLFPAVFLRRQLHTTGFMPQGRNMLLSWPIWEQFVNVDTMRSLLALAEIQLPKPDRAKLYALGILEVYRCERITNGKYRNLTQAYPA